MTLSNEDRARLEQIEERAEPLDPATCASNKLLRHSIDSLENSLGKFQQSSDKIGTLLIILTVALVVLGSLALSPLYFGYVRENCFKQTHVLLGTKSSGLNVYAYTDQTGEVEYQDCLRANGQ